MAKKWDSLELRKSSIEKIAKIYNFSNYEDWYKLTRKMILDQGFGELIKYYQQSPYLLVKNSFPEYEWKPWLFENMPRNFWQHKENIMLFFQWLAKELNIEKPEDWYLIDSNTLEKYGFYKSLYQSLILIYPDYDWKSWLFSNPPKHLWNDEKNIRNYFLWLSKELNIAKAEDWYKITAIDLKPYNVGGMINRKFGHMCNFLKCHIPNYDWKPWLFKSVPSGYWHDKNNHRIYGEWLEKTLNIDSKEKRKGC
jgi:hypothetical protein